MEIHLSPEQELQLNQLAARTGRAPTQFASEVLSRALDEERLFVEAVEMGIAAADRGEWIEHDDVLAYIERLP